MYPYSVVPGGVETAHDLEDATASDSATAEHYRDVSVATLQPTRLAAATLAYVSYRKNGRIYWTRRQVYLAAGERVLSNGRDCVRGRCGNRVSLTPRNPVIEEAGREPAAEVFSTPAVNGLAIDEIAPPLVMTLFSMPSLAIPPAAPEYHGSTAQPVTTATIAPKGGPETWPPGPAPAAMPAASGMPAILPPGPPSPMAIMTPSPVVVVVNIPAVPITPALFVMPSYLQPSAPQPYSGLSPALPWSVVSSVLPPSNAAMISSMASIPSTIVGSTPSPPAFRPPAEHNPPGSSPPPQNLPPCCTTASQSHPPADTTPEPGSWLLLAAGLAVLWIVRTAGSRPLIAIMIRYEQAARHLRFDARRPGARSRRA